MVMSEHIATEDSDPLSCPAVVGLTCDSPSDELLPPGSRIHLNHSCTCNTVLTTKTQSAYYDRHNSLFTIQNRFLCRLIYSMSVQDYCVAREIELPNVPFPILPKNTQTGA